MEEYFAYVGTMPCGCRVAACVDDPRWAKDTAKDVANMIKEGLRVERIKGPVSIAACIHKPARKTKHP